MYYQNLFNQNYINELEYQRLCSQIDQIQFDMKQQEEIGKMVKALDDFFDSAQKIAPQYQNQANMACMFEICKRFYGNNY